MAPAERDCAQSAAGQFGERMVRHGFAAIQKERNAVATKNASQRFVRAIERAHEHCDFAKPAAAANEAKNFTRDEDCFSVEVRALDYANWIGRSGAVRR